MSNLKKLTTKIVKLFSASNTTHAGKTSGHHGHNPAKSDQELMENVQARLPMFGTPVSGTVLRSVPGVTVKFFALAGQVVPTVFEAGTDRPIGSILPGGLITYVEPRTH